MKNQRNLIKIIFKNNWDNKKTTEYERLIRSSLNKEIDNLKSNKYNIYYKTIIFENILYIKSINFYKQDKKKKRSREKFKELLEECSFNPLELLKNKLL